MNATQRQHIADTLKTARLRRGWTQAHAAELVGTTDGTWSRWEKAQVTPEVAMFPKLAELLDLPEDWMVLPTVQQPSRTVTTDEMLERITAELTEQRRLLEDMRRQMTGADNARPDDARGNQIERDVGRDVADARRDDGARHDQDSR